MLLKELSNLIVVDELNNAEADDQCIHFISHYDSDIVFDQNFKSKIYTSTNIGNILSSPKYEIPMHHFEILKDRCIRKVILSNGDTLKVALFKDRHPSGSALFYFEVNSKTAIYLGHFKQLVTLIWNESFRSLVSNGIDYLYIDNTNANSVYHSTENEVSLKIKELLKSHTKIILNTPEYGYENLIKTFIEIYDFKVYIGNNITKMIFYDTECYSKIVQNFKECEIAMYRDYAPIDVIKKRLDLKKMATVRLFDFQKKFDNKNYEKFGLYQYCYSSHISRMEMYSFITLIQPKHIIEIYSDLAKIPNFIKSASKRWKYEVENEPLNEDNEMHNIEDFARDTEIDDPDQLQTSIEKRISEIESNKPTDDHSTDCEEVEINDDQSSDHIDKLSEKIKEATRNIPKRRTVKDKPLIIDLSPEHNRNKIENETNLKVNEDEKTLNENKKEVIDKPRKNLLASILNANFASMNTTLSDLDESQSVYIEKTTVSSVSAQKNAIEDMQLEKRQKDFDKNYITFIDSNSSSLQESNFENQNEKQESLSVEKMYKSPAIILSNTIVEKFRNSLKSNFSRIESKILSEKKDECRINLEKSSSKTSEENEKIETPKAISYSLVQSLIRSETQVQNTNKEDKTTETSKSQITEKHYNPFKKISKQDETEKNDWKESTNVNGLKIDENKSSKINPSKSNENGHKIGKRKSIGSRRRSNRRKISSESGNSLEVCKVTNEVIEIIDKSPPRVRQTRSSINKKSDPIEIKSKRTFKRNTKVVQLYIDDDEN